MILVALARLVLVVMSSRRAIPPRRAGGPGCKPLGPGLRVGPAVWLPSGLPWRDHNLQTLLISEAAAGFGRSPLLWFGALGSDVRTIL